MSNLYRLNKPDKMTELHKLGKIWCFCQSQADKSTQTPNVERVRCKSSKKHCVQQTKSRTTHALCNFVTNSIDTISDFRVLRRKSNKKHCVTVSLKFGQKYTRKVILLRSINPVGVTVVPGCETHPHVGCTTSRHTPLSVVSTRTANRAYATARRQAECGRLSFAPMAEDSKALVSPQEGR